MHVATWLWLVPSGRIYDTPFPLPDFSSPVIVRLETLFSLLSISSGAFDYFTSLSVAGPLQLVRPNNHE